MTEVGRTGLGRIAVEQKALEQLVRDAAEDGGAQVASVRLSLAADEGATVAVSVEAPRRVVLPALGAALQRRIAGVLESSLGAAPARVDVTVEGIRPEEDG
ncbi:MAG TPA: hypothetical protein VFR32_08975 [Gaiellaceae bacterium]|nr:hypothetical protein [Gaiellaceae bacterium]